MSTLSLDLRGVEATHALPREAPARGASVSLLVHGAVISTLILIPLLQSTNPPQVARADTTPLLRPITVTLPPPPLRIAARPRAQSRGPSASAVAPVLSTPADVPDSLPVDTAFDLLSVPDFDGPPSGPVGRIDGTCPPGSLCGTAAVPVEGPPRAVVRIGGLIREPRLVEGHAPIYPPMAQAAGVGGKVVLEAHVGPDGRVREVRILEGHALFNEAAKDSVRSRRYEPLRLNEVPTAFLITITVAFKTR